MSSEFKRVCLGRGGAERMSTRVSRYLLSVVACFAATVTRTSTIPRKSGARKGTACQGIGGEQRHVDCHVADDRGRTPAGGQ